MRLLAIFLIKIYQWCISPCLPKCCAFYPTCSNYMLIAIKEWGVVKGVFLGIKRLVKCRPHGGSGEDFVPLNIKGDMKWFF
ncbi:MAG: membrane protein insertion efficiency factor YidD [Clostridiales bacterium]|nr:membrane protein insertion efficiency factor YidD [Clostridiales bacterium]